MAVRNFRGPELPPLIPQPIPTGLFMIGRTWMGSTYYAVRDEAPHFILEGEDINELYQEAEANITRFLSKMHRYGFRR